MTFIRLETWDIANARRHGSPSNTASNLAESWTSLPSVRRLAATSVSLLIHALGTWLLLQHGFSRPGEPSTKGTASSAAVFSLMENAEAEAEPAPASPLTATSPPSTSAAPEIEAAESPLLPPEWTKIRIKVQKASPQPSSNVSPGQEQQAAASPPAGQNPGSARAASTAGGYDPYAGAAPMREPERLALPPRQPTPAADPPETLLGSLAGAMKSAFNWIPGLAATPRLKQSAFEAWMRMLRTQTGARSGEIKMIVTVSPDGRVIDALVTSESTGARIAAVARAQVVGRELFERSTKITSPRKFRMPTILLTH